MNEQVKKALEDLIFAIKSGEEYENYVSLRKALKKQPEKVEKLNAFRKERFLACLEADGGFGKMEELLIQKQEIEKDRECKEFLAWENEFCQEIRKITEEILSLVDLSIPVAEEGEDTNGLTKA